MQSGAGQLVVIDRSGRAGKRLQISEGAFTIGRASACDIKVLLPTVSPHHATIVVHTNQTIIRNVGSGETLVNGQAISVAALQHDDVITVGDRCLRWQYDAPPSRKPLKLPEIPYKHLRAGRTPRRVTAATLTDTQPHIRKTLEMSHRASMPGNAGGKQVAIVQPQRRETGEPGTPESNNRSAPISPRSANRARLARSEAIDAEPGSPRGALIQVHNTSPKISRIDTPQPSPSLLQATKASLWIESRKSSPRKSASQVTPARAVPKRAVASAKKSTPLRLTVLRKAQSAHKAKVTKIEAPLKIDAMKQAALMLMTGHSRKLSASPKLSPAGPTLVVGKRGSSNARRRSKGKRGSRGSKGKSVSVLEITDTDATSQSTIASDTELYTRSRKSSLGSPLLPSPPKSALKDPRNRKSSRKHESIKFDLSNLENYDQETDVLMVSAGARSRKELNTPTTLTGDSIALYYSDTSQRSPVPSPRRSIHSRTSKMMELVGSPIDTSRISDYKDATLTPGSPRSSKSLRGSIIMQKALETTESNVSRSSRRASNTLTDQSFDSTAESAFRTRTVSPKSARNMESYSIVDLVSMDSNETGKSESIYGSVGSTRTSSIVFGTPQGSTRKTRSTIDATALSSSTPYGNRSRTSVRSRSNPSIRRSSPNKTSSSSRRSQSLTTPENSEETQKHISINSTRISRASKSRSRINESDLQFLNSSIGDGESPKTSRRNTKADKSVLDSTSPIKSPKVSRIIVSEKSPQASAGRKSALEVNDSVILTLVNDSNYRIGSRRSITQNTPKSNLSQIKARKSKSVTSPRRSASTSLQKSPKSPKKSISESILLNESLISTGDSDSRIGSRRSIHQSSLKNNVSQISGRKSKSLISPRRSASASPQKSPKSPKKSISKSLLNESLLSNGDGDSQIGSRRSIHQSSLKNNVSQISGRKSKSLISGRKSKSLISPRRSASGSPQKSPKSPKKSISQSIILNESLLSTGHSDSRIGSRRSIHQSSLNNVSQISGRKSKSLISPRLSASTSPQKSPKSPKKSISKSILLNESLISTGDSDSRIGSRRSIPQSSLKNNVSQISGRKSKSLISPRRSASASAQKSPKSPKKSISESILLNESLISTGDSDSRIGPRRSIPQSSLKNNVSQISGRKSKSPISPRRSASASPQKSPRSPKKSISQSILSRKHNKSQVIPRTSLRKSKKSSIMSTPQSFVTSEESQVKERISEINPRASLRKTQASPSWSISQSTLLNDSDITPRDSAQTSTRKSQITPRGSVSQSILVQYNTQTRRSKWLTSPRGSAKSSPRKSQGTPRGSISPSILVQDQTQTRRSKSLTSPKESAKSSPRKSQVTPRGSVSQSILVQDQTQTRRSKSLISPRESEKSSPRKSQVTPRGSVSQSILVQDTTQSSTRRSKSLITPRGTAKSSPKRSISQISPRQNTTKQSSSESPSAKKAHLKKSPISSTKKRSSLSNLTLDVSQTTAEGIVTPENRNSPPESSTPVLSIRSLLNSSQSSFASQKSPRHTRGSKNVKRKSIGVLRSTKKVHHGRKSKSFIVSSLKSSRSSKKNSKLNESIEENVTPKSAVKLVQEAVKNKHSTAKKPQSKRSIIDNLNESDIVKQLFNSPVKRNLSRSMTEFSKKKLFDDDNAPELSIPDNSDRYTPEHFVSPLSTPSSSPNLSGIKRLYTRNSPKNDLSNIHGVKRLYRTPHTRKSVKNDLRNVSGVKAVFAASPRNDLRRVTGVKSLFQSEKKQKSPRNDLSDIREVKKLVTRKSTVSKNRSPKNDLLDVRGVKELFRGRKSNRSADLSGVQELFDGSVVSNTSTRSAEALFDQLVGKPPIKAVYSKSLISKCPQKVKPRRNSLRKSIDTNNVEQWIEQELQKHLHKEKTNQSKTSRQLRQLATDTVTGNEIRTTRTRNTSILKNTSNRNKRLTSEVYSPRMLPIKKRSFVEASLQKSANESSKANNSNNLPIKKRIVVHSTPVKGRYSVTLNASELGRVSPIAALDNTYQPDNAGSKQQPKQKTIRLTKHHIIEESGLENVNTLLIAPTQKSKSEIIQTRNNKSQKSVVFKSPISKASPIQSPKGKKSPVGSPKGKKSIYNKVASPKGLRTKGSPRVVLSRMATKISSKASPKVVSPKETRRRPKANTSEVAIEESPKPKRGRSQINTIAIDVNQPRSKRTKNNTENQDSKQSPKKGKGKSNNSVPSPKKSQQSPEKTDIAAETRPSPKKTRGSRAKASPMKPGKSARNNADTTVATNTKKRRNSLVITKKAPVMTPKPAKGKQNNSVPSPKKPQRAPGKAEIAAKTEPSPKKTRGTRAKTSPMNPGKSARISTDTTVATNTKKRRKSLVITKKAPAMTPKPAKGKQVDKVASPKRGTRGKAKADIEQSKSPASTPKATRARLVITKPTPKLNPRAKNTRNATDSNKTKNESPKKLPSPKRGRRNAPAESPKKTVTKTAEPKKAAAKKLSEKPEQSTPAKRGRAQNVEPTEPPAKRGRTKKDTSYVKQPTPKKQSPTKSDPKKTRGKNVTQETLLSEPKAKKSKTTATAETQRGRKRKSTDDIAAVPAKVAKTEAKNTRGGKNDEKLSPVKKVTPAKGRALNSPVKRGRAKPASQVKVASPVKRGRAKPASPVKVVSPVKRGRAKPASPVKVASPVKRGRAKSVSPVKVVSPVKRGRTKPASPVKVASPVKRGRAKPVSPVKVVSPAKRGRAKPASPVKVASPVKRGRAKPASPVKVASPVKRGRAKPVSPVKVVSPAKRGGRAKPVSPVKVVSPAKRGRAKPASPVKVVSPVKRGRTKAPSPTKANPTSPVKGRATGNKKDVPKPKESAKAKKDESLVNTMRGKRQNVKETKSVAKTQKTVKETAAKTQKGKTPMKAKNVTSKNSPAKKAAVSASVAKRSRNKKGVASPAAAERSSRARRR